MNYEVKSRGAMNIGIHFVQIDDFKSDFDRHNLTAIKNRSFNSVENAIVPLIPLEKMVFWKERL